jgi:pimeloyl-ACP methyl ester carboxylesterase
MNASDFCQSLTPHYVTVGGIRTHYVECGKGPTIVLVHGLSACFWNWWRNLPALSQHFRVIAYDLKGCGNSAKPRGPYTTEACVAQLTGLLDELSIPRASLVGHSLGARIALNTALACPDRVQSLVLVSPSCYPQTAGRAVSWLILPGIGELYTQLLFSGRADYLVRRALRGCMHPEAVINDEDVYWNMLSGVAEKRRLAQTYLRYGRQIQFHKPWALAQRYSEITAPTLIIGGDSDRLVPTMHSEQLARTLPQARLEIWPNTGHLPHSEQPERFNSTISAFLHEQQQPSPRQRWDWLQQVAAHF